MTVTYDYAPNTTRVVTDIESGVQQTTDFGLVYQNGRFLPTVIQGACSSCGGGGADHIEYTYDPATNDLLSKTVGSSTGPTGDERVQTTYQYNSNGLVTSMTEAVGKPEQRTTTIAYGKADWPRFVTSRTIASIAKSGANRVDTYTWNSSGAKESTLTTQISGYLLATDSAPTVYQTTQMFDGSGNGSTGKPHRILEIGGPDQTGQPARNQKTTLAYYSDTDSNVNLRGRLQQRNVYTSATAFLTTSYSDYDVFGTARQETDPNGVILNRITDGRGRVTSSISRKPSGDANEPPDYTTTFDYDTRDRLTRTISPRGNRVSYRYQDGTNALTDTIRSDGIGSDGNQRERVHTVYNTVGRVASQTSDLCTTPAAECSTWSTERSESYTYDTTGRLAATTHDDATSIHYTYDSRGNLLAVKDERHTAAGLGANTEYAYDPLDRLSGVTQHQSIVSGSDVVTQYSYDTAGNLRSVTDPNGNPTSYDYDDFGRMQKQTSPVSGVTTYSYDAAANLTSTTDANGAATARQYDASNRPTNATSTRTGSTTETVTWAYDDATAGKYRKGRLSTMTDPSGGSRIFSYERRGLLMSELWSRGRFSYSPQASYGYDANGNRSSVTYPSGSVVQYTFDWADRPLAAGTTTNANFYAHDAQYAPFGPMTSLTYGNGTVRAYGLDANHRYLPSALSLTGSSQTVSYQYGTDAGGNITSIADSGDAAYNRTFAYDDLNRLMTANSGASLWGNGSYTYDAMGNMVTMSLGSLRSEAFTYSGTTPKIATVSENGAPAVSVSYDAAGNETAVGTTTFSYSTRNSLLSASAPSLTYTYDGRGLRAFTHGAWATVSPTRYFMYSPELRLLSEYDEVVGPSPLTGLANESYVWFGTDLIAEIDHTQPATYWVFTDHLGTPLVLTDAGATVVWRAEYEPYGKIFAYRTGNSSFHQPVRLPGQEAEQFDTVGSDRYYNIFRWYRSAWGRYTQSDPLGQTGGVNLFDYAGENPVRIGDPTGLQGRDRIPSAEEIREMRERQCAKGAFLKNYADMRNANWKMSDKYFHCKANCEATRCGKYGEREACDLGDLRELSDRLLFGESVQDAAADQAANRYGREQSKASPSISCSTVCSAFRPKGLPSQY